MGKVAEVRRVVDSQYPNDRKGRGHNILHLTSPVGSVTLSN